MAISIPIFTKQLEKSRESTDAANLRAAYAEVMAAALDESAADTTVTVNKDASGAVTTITTDVKCSQKKTGWDNSNITDIGGIAITSVSATTLKGWTVTYTQSTGAVTFTEKTGA